MSQLPAVTALEPPEADGDKSSDQSDCEIRDRFSMKQSSRQVWLLVRQRHEHGTKDDQELYRCPGSGCAGRALLL
jgi:hypothetical protein